MMRAITVGVLMCLLSGSLAHAATDRTAEAARLLGESSISGGLLVHVGCGDGTLTAALHANARYVVQGLTTDARQCDQTRTALRQAGVYWPVIVCLSSMIPSICSLSRTG